MRRAGGIALWGILWVVPSACSGQMPDNLGIRNGRLAACPESPNCVCSDAADDAHRIEPLRLAAPPSRAWEALRATLVTKPRVTIVAATDDYLRAEARSRVFRFVDDVEFHLRAGEGVIAMRSASRIGRSDLGVNRRRMEDIRAELRRRGVVR